MNSLFNYELDERQIRLTLHDAELESADLSWMEFEGKYPGDHSNQAKVFQFNLPKINLNINRNVLVPIFFIVALGGVSAIMFKFIDFKANTSVEAERALESDPSNLKNQEKIVALPEKETAPVQKIIQPEVKKEEPVITNNNSVQTNSFAAIQKTEALRQQFVEPVLVQRNNSVPDTATAQKTPMAAVNQDKPPVHEIIYKKRRKKLVVEQIETIKAPSLLSAQAAPEEEPELKIKQN